ncbi:TonB-dependent receptor plug domain-containing protein [Thalassotalea aquiviva]|uniref:TonB-dependent receptor plug domain-containing protein n=1 Tax=Thalassotalea aquiviva TaxID=3242415 RepID=UPI00352A169A
MNVTYLFRALRVAGYTSLATTLIYVPSTYTYAEENEQKIERIEVTGSRLKRTDLETPVPVTVIGREEILASGALNVADVLNQSPIAIAGSSSSNSAFTTSAVGLNTTALRNLGDERTLVLVNGRRFISGKDPSSGYAVDLNSIPTSMIERIEILKSASSAIYGSDAVAGVVNIILRKNFEGIELNLSTGISGEGDREQYSLSLTGGHSWNSGNVTMSIGYDDDKGLRSSDRDFSALDEAILLDENGKEYRGELFSSFPPQGRIGSTSSGYNGDGTPFSNDNRFNRASYRQLVTPLERKYAAFNFNQELSDDVKIFTEVNWNNASTYDSTIEPSALDIGEDVWLQPRGGTGGMSIYSPLVPELLRTNLEADGITNINELDFVRRMVEFGPRSTDLERDTIRIATGLDWDIDGNWQLNTFLSWGKTDQNQDNGGQVNIERAILALDAEVDPDTGELRCVSQHARLQGCTPLNLFGAGTISDDAIAYVSSPAKVKGQAEQFIVGASVVGELPWELDGGNVGMVFGYEHRLEKGEFSPGDLAQTGASNTNLSLPTKGSFYTDDWFVEFGLPFADNFQLDLAARYSDHEITGGDVTWNAGLEYSPSETLMFRASAATAVRTPNIADLYGGRGETFASVSDPCSGLESDGSDGIAANIRANCLSISEVADRVASTGSFTLSQVEAQNAGGTIGGNENVKEETAQTYSLGVVWQVTDALSLTVDYYDISIEDAIRSTSRTTVLNRCFDVATSEFDPNCGSYQSPQGPAPVAVRDQNGALLEVHSGTSNENDLDTKGLDIEVSYSTDIGPGTLKTLLVWNYIDEWIETSIEDGTSVDYVGEVLTPDNRANLNITYLWDDFTVTWRTRFWDKSVDSVNEDNFNFSNFEPLQESNTFGSYIMHDLAADYYYSEDVKFGFVIKNAFDKQPPFAGQGFLNSSTGVNTVPDAYDITGRYFQANVTFKF